MLTRYATLAWKEWMRQQSATARSSHTHGCTSPLFGAANSNASSALSPLQGCGRAAPVVPVLQQASS
jgi:hypothetical protein